MDKVGQNIFICTYQCQVQYINYLIPIYISFTFRDVQGFIAHKQKNNLHIYIYNNIYHLA